MEEGSADDMVLFLQEKSPVIAKKIIHEYMPMVAARGSVSVLCSMSTFGAVEKCLKKMGVIDMKATVMGVRERRQVSLPYVFLSGEIGEQGDAGTIAVSINFTSNNFHSC